MNTILLHDILGNEIRTRIFFRRSIESLIRTSPEVRLDFSGVIFITRSVADEIYNIQLDYPKIEIVNLYGEAKKMFDIVKNSRKSPRVYEEPYFQNVRLSTVDEAIRYFNQAL